MVSFKIQELENIDQVFLATFYLWGASRLKMKTAHPEMTSQSCMADAVCASQGDVMSHAMLSCIPLMRSPRELRAGDTARWAQSRPSSLFTTRSTIKNFHVPRNSAHLQSQPQWLPSDPRRPILSTYSADPGGWTFVKSIICLNPQSVVRFLFMPKLALSLSGSRCWGLGLQRVSLWWPGMQ